MAGFEEGRRRVEEAEAQQSLAASRESINWRITGTAALLPSSLLTTSGPIHCALHKYYINSRSLRADYLERSVIPRNRLNSICLFCAVIWLVAVGPQKCANAAACCVRYLARLTRGNPNGWSHIMYCQINRFVKFMLNHVRNSDPDDWRDSYSLHCCYRCAVMVLDDVSGRLGTFRGSKDTTA